MKILAFGKGTGSFVGGKIDARKQEVEKFLNYGLKLHFVYIFKIKIALNVNKSLVSRVNYLILYH